MWVHGGERERLKENKSPLRNGYPAPLAIRPSQRRRSIGPPISLPPRPCGQRCWVGVAGFTKRVPGEELESFAKGAGLGAEETHRQAWVFNEAGVGDMNIKQPYNGEPSRLHLAAIRAFPS